MLGLVCHVLIGSLVHDRKVTYVGRIFNYFGFSCAEIESQDVLVRDFGFLLLLDRELLSCEGSLVLV